MTATNLPFEGMSNDAESATLAGVALAVEWADVLKDGLPKRTTQRVVIYQPSLTKLETVLVTGNVGLNMEDGHDIAYERIFAAAQKFERLPVFFSSDSEDFGGLEIRDKVPLWMHTAAQISTGGRRQVLEDGPDVCNSESDSDNEDHGEKLTGMYIGVPLDSEGRPLDASYKLTSEQAAAQRARYAQASASTPPASAPAPTPQGKRTKKGKKAAPEKASQSEHPMTTRSIAKVSPEESTQEQPGPKKKSKKASRAGGLRPAAGSGLTDTRVAQSNPSQT
jgi:hypothetical protein